MSYEKVQQEKNDALIDQEMEGCLHQDIADVRRLCHDTWATDYEATSIIKERKKEIANRATPDELNEAFKHLRV